jgi:sortase A
MWRLNKSVEGKDDVPKRVVARLRRARTLLFWIERILLFSGLTLFAFYGGARLEGWLTSRAAMKQFAAANASSDSGEETGSGNIVGDTVPGSTKPKLPGADFGLWSEQRIKAYKEGAPKRSVIPLAVLRIPRIRLEAPIFDGTDELTLNHGLGRIAKTASPNEAGNIGIAGHRDGFFRGLKDVVPGDAIKLTTREGTATYLVDRIRIVSPRQVEVLRPTSVPTLTLVTCYPFYFFGSAPQRYIVTASLSKEKIGGTENSLLSAPVTASNSNSDLQRRNI